ncbi:major facilitator superfamily domain-containing protein [Aspergillus aurantiobrunneus]
MAPSPATAENASDDSDSASVGHWNGDDDPRNPRNWSMARRLSIVALVTFATLNDSIASTIFSPAVPHILQEFQVSSAPLSSFLISVHAIGFSIGPFLCPITEVYGRSPMMHASNALFVLSAVLCAVSTNIGMLISARIIMGVAGCVPAVLGVVLSTFYLATAYVYMYFLLTTFPRFFGERYGFSQGQIGLTYIGPIIGLLGGQFIFGPFLDWYHKRQLRIRGFSIPLLTVIEITNLTYKLTQVKSVVTSNYIGIFWAQDQAEM